MARGHSACSRHHRGICISTWRGSEICCCWCLAGGTGPSQLPPHLRDGELLPDLYWRMCYCQANCNDAALLLHCISCRQPRHAQGPAGLKGALTPPAAACDTHVQGPSTAPCTAAIHSLLPRLLDAFSCSKARSLASLCVAGSFTFVRAWVRRSCLPLRELPALRGGAGNSRLPFRKGQAVLGSACCW